MALLITQHASYSTLFWLEFLTGLIALIASLFVKSDKVYIETKPVAKQANQRFDIRTLMEPRVLPISLTLGFVTIGYAALQADLDFFASQLHRKLRPLWGVAAAAAVVLGVFFYAEYLRKPYCYIDGVAIYDKEAAMQATVYLQGLSDFGDQVRMVDELIINE